jgi:hypothetical protein
MAPQYPLINGHRPDWARTLVHIDGQDREIGITEVNYSGEGDPGEVYGAGSEQIADTLGTYKASGDITLLLEEGQALITRLGHGFMAKRFGITVSYRLVGSDLITHELTGCRIKKPDNSNKQGNEAAMMKFDLTIMRIKYNGILPMPDMVEI